MSSSNVNTKRKKSASTAAAKETYEHPVLVPNHEQSAEDYAAQLPLPGALRAQRTARALLEEEYASPKQMERHVQTVYHQSAAPEDVDNRMLLAQERLESIRREADELERERQILSELRHKQESFTQGRAEITDKLARTMALLEREAEESRRKVEQMRLIRDTFEQHFDAVNSITPEDWNPDDPSADLTRSLGIVEDAKVEYDRHNARIHALTAGTGSGLASDAILERKPFAMLPPGMNKDTYKFWVFCGLAFTTPVLVIALLCTLLMLIF
jgi:hypothetical protein